jgi:hypothetical protein
LLEHSKAEFLVVEYYLWRAIMQDPGVQDIKTKLVLVTEAPLGADLAGAYRWEEFRGKGEPDFVMRRAKDAAHRLFVGHGRAAQGMRAHA